MNGRKTNEVLFWLLHALEFHSFDSVLDFNSDDVGVGMKKVTTEHLCDVCGKNATKLQLKTGVIFTTEQTEGRSVAPHPSIETVDLCESCYKWHISGQMIFGSGAMGYNKYWFLTACRECAAVRSGGER